MEERGRCCRLTWTSGQLIVPAFNNVTTPLSAFGQMLLEKSEAAEEGSTATH